MSMIAFSRQLDDRSATFGRLTIIRRAIVSGASTFCAGFLAAMHASRRKQAAIELAKYRDLIHDPETVTCSAVTARSEQPADSDLHELRLSSGDRTARA
jgi:hypothetical protein